MKNIRKYQKGNKTDERLHFGRKKNEVIFPVAPLSSSVRGNYHAFLSGLKEKIRRERLRVVLSSNAALVMLYWDIGRNIVQKQYEEGWGSKVIDRLSADLIKEFPDMRGFSPRNLKYMRSFAVAWPDKAIVQGALAQLSWYHHIALLDKLDDMKSRLWYAQKTQQHGWSRNVLVIQIEANQYQRTGKIVSNFSIALPPSDSDMAKQVFKDPYLFDFLGTADTRREKEVEQALVDHIQRFLLELGQGFAFVGRQVHLELGGNDYYLDLLFYHLKLRRYIVIELKVGDFIPEYVGKMNMYMSVVDDVLRHTNDNPAIGLLLVKQKNKLVAEYALRGYAKPIGIAQWKTRITRALPDGLKSNLPTVEEIEIELSKDKVK